jgi:YVTN family beta-propeller protein
MRITILLLVSSIFLIVGCKEQATTVQPPSGEFSTQVKPILDRSCGGPDCHGGGPRGFAASLDLTSYEGIFRGSRNGTVVVSGNPYMSALVQTINQTDTTLSPISSAKMPLSRDPLPNGEVQTIVQWIRNGARKGDGSLPFPEPRPLGKVFFTSQSVDLAGVIDISTGLIMRYVSVGNTLPFNTPPQSPHNVQIDDQGLYYYVTLIRGNKLRKYDAATNELLGEVRVGSSPAHVVITPDGSKAYVTNFDLAVGQVIVVNTAGTMTVTDTIHVSNFMKGTHGARLSHDGRFLYVGNNGTDLITVIQTSDNSVITHVPVTPDVPPFGSFTYKPYQIAVRGDDRFIYVTCNGRALVSVIERNGDTFSWRDTIPVGRNPLQCEVTRDQRFLYVCNQGSGSVSVIDAQTNRLFTTIDSVGVRPHGVDISDDSRTVYVTLENTQGGEPPHHPIVGSAAPAFLAVIDVLSNRVIRKIEVGGFAAGVSVFPGRGN